MAFFSKKSPLWLLILSCNDLMVHDKKDKLEEKLVIHSKSRTILQLNMNPKNLVFPSLSKMASLTFSGL